MKYLVGVRVADPAEQPRISERSLESVILPSKSFGELREICFEDLEPAPLELLERFFTSHEPE